MRTQRYFWFNNPKFRKIRVKVDPHEKVWKEKKSVKEKKKVCKEKKYYDVSDALGMRIRIIFIASNVLYFSNFLSFP